MVTSVTPYRAATSVVLVGGTPVTVMFGPLQGGVVENPQLAGDQNLAEAEVLFIDLVNPASLSPTLTTMALQPGQSYSLPAGQTTNVSVNAASSGHRFSAYALQPAPQEPVIPAGIVFPPDGPTSLLKTIKSYLYVQYNDDDDLQAFVAAQNTLTQQYADWFNTLNLPVYTGTPISGLLLDWVARGLYGQVRPSLSSDRNQNLGPLNTYTLNTLPLNAFKTIGPQNVTATTDDIFKRIITWNFLKGDGKAINIRWLKRRIMRFLNGVNGVNVATDQTYQVSVTFGVGNQVNIGLIKGTRTITGGAILNGFALNTVTLNQLNSVFVNLIPLQNTRVLKEAIDSGALQLPFQFDYVVTV